MSAASLAAPVRVVRTDGRDPAYAALVRPLDAELRERYGELQDTYDTFNVFIPDHVVLALDGEAPVGCGCLKRFDDPATPTAELKRMYVAPEARRRGVGRALVAALEAWARELGYAAVVLETGDRQPEAVRLYEACGFTRTPSYRPYTDLPTSLCMRKLLEEER